MCYPYGNEKNTTHMYLNTYDNDFIGTKQNETTAIGTKIKTTSINVKAFREIKSV